MKIKCFTRQTLSAAPNIVHHDHNHENDIYLNDEGIEDEESRTED
jgi:hypothetical protein